MEELKKQIESSTQCVILSHRSPDGDSIGSSLALYHYLKNFPLKTTVISPDPAANFLKWMSGFEDVINYEQNKNEAEQLIAGADLIFCLDFNTPSRMGEMATAFEKNTSAFIINIDHHQQPDNFADFQLSDPEASSTCQLIYEFIENLNDTNKINEEMAACIYTGMVTDTGSFRFSSTSKRTHQIVAELIGCGINPGKIHQNIYDNYSIDRLKLLGFALNERFKFYEKYSTGIIYLAEEDLEQFNFQKGDTEGLVNYPLSISTIKMAILITEKSGKVKMSFRSKDDFSVNEFARKYFNGGGHFNAAGGISDLSVMDTVKKIESILPEYKELHA